MSGQNGRKYLPNTLIEIVQPNRPCGPLRHVLFDFDGTISLIREGWQQIMVAMMVEFLLETPQAEAEEAMVRAMTDFVWNSMGQPTIDQMAHLTAEVARHGGQPKSPEEYKSIFLGRLLRCVNERVASLKNGQVSPVELAVPGVFDLLATLHEQDVTCYLASGTERKAVVTEAETLGLAHYFYGRIYGPDDTGPAFSKQQVVHQILREAHLPGCALVAFGDGKAEIEYTAAVGGIGVGVASNELERQGINEVKRRQLIRAGACLVTPDFRESESLLHYLSGDEA